MIALEGYLLALVIMSGIYGVLALGLNLQWGLTGQFNIGIAGFFAVGAYTSAIMTTDAPVSPGHMGGLDLPIAAGFLAAMLVSAVLALGVGLITIRLRADYLAIATIGIAEILRLVLKNWESLTNGVRGITPIPRPFEASLGQGWGAAVTVLVTLVLAFLAAEACRRSPWGRVLRAIRENEAGAMAVGKNVARFRLEAFVLGSAFMGLGGALYAHYVGFISPEAFTPLFGTFIVWVMLVSGGSGNNYGAVLGALVIWLLWSTTEIATEFLTEALPPEWKTRAGAVRVLLVGLLLQAVLLLRPEGLLPERRR